MHDLKRRLAQLRAAGMDLPEIRLVPLSILPAPLELRSAEGAPDVLIGYAAVFDQETIIDDWGFRYREVIAPGAFADAIREKDDAFCLWQHNPEKPLASFRGGSLSLSEDDHGLLIAATLGPESYCLDAAASVRRKVVTHMSFMFSARDKGGIVFEPEQGDNLPLRTLKKLRLYDASPVTRAAYDGTECGMRDRLVARALGLHCGNCQWHGQGAASDSASDVDPAQGSGLPQDDWQRVLVGQNLELLTESLTP